MRFEIVHATSYLYSAPVRESHMELRLQPRDGGGQRLEAHHLDVRPSARLGRYLDGFGNRVHYFDRLPAHESLDLVSRSTVETGLEHDPEADRLTPFDLLQPRPPVVDGAGVRRLARRIRIAERPESAQVDAAMRTIVRLIARNFEYRPMSTTVLTTVDDVIRLRSGVCQDFAHLWRVPRTPGPRPSFPTAAGPRTTRRIPTWLPSTTFGSRSAVIIATRHRRAGSSSARRPARWRCGSRRGRSEEIGVADHLFPATCPNAW
jgi:hypothetical protein